MRTKLLLEQFDKNGKLIDKREQFSRSFTLNFIRLLYVQHSQLSHLGLPVSASNLQICSLPGYSSLFNSQGQMFGIMVGSGSGTPAPLDTCLFTPICHGQLYRAGAPATFLNPSFETGDFTNWTNSGGTIQSGDWDLKEGTYFAQLKGSGTFYIEQSVDLTNVTTIAFQFRLANYGGGTPTFSMKVDGTIVFERAMTASSDYPLQIVGVSAYSGAHTIRFGLTSTSSNNCVILDAIKTYGSQLEFGGCELNYLRFGVFPHNGEFTISRYFTNHCGNNVSVTEAGMVAYPGLLIAHDTFVAITLADGQLLRVSYIPQITV